MTARYDAFDRDTLIYESVRRSNPVTKKREPLESHKFHFNISHDSLYPCSFFCDSFYDGDSGGNTPDGDWRDHSSYAT